MREIEVKLTPEITDEPFVKFSRDVAAELNDDSEPDLNCGS
jgi:hypothetical protein